MCYINALIFTGPSEGKIRFSHTAITVLINIKFAQTHFLQLISTSTAQSRIQKIHRLSKYYAICIFSMLS